MNEAHLTLTPIKTGTGKVILFKGKFRYIAYHPSGISIAVEIPKEMGTLTALKLSIKDIKFIK